MSATALPISMSGGGWGGGMGWRVPSFLTAQIPPVIRLHLLLSAGSPFRLHKFHPPAQSNKKKKVSSIWVVLQKTFILDFKSSFRCVLSLHGKVLIVGGLQGWLL